MYMAYESWDTATRAALRIYDPFSYRPALYERIVPISLSEALPLAERYPVIWRRDLHGDPELVVLRGLDAKAEIPGARAQSRLALPLLLQAFPFRFRDTARGTEIGVDQSAPMREGDAGSYIHDPQGNLLPGAEMKLGALEAFQADADTRLRLTAAVFRHGLIEPVVLPDEIVAKYDLPDFFVVLPFPDDALIFEDIPYEHWPLAARFLAAQRMSLYTMGRLIAAAEGTAA